VLLQVGPNPRWWTAAILKISKGYISATVFGVGGLNGAISFRAKSKITDGDHSENLKWPYLGNVSHYPPHFWF